MRFNIGDKVIVDDGDMVGDVGRIVRFDDFNDEGETNEKYLWVLVTFEEEGPYTHNADGSLTRHNGRWFRFDDMTKVVVTSIEDDPEYSELFI